MAQVTFTMKTTPPASTGTAGNMYYNSTNNELYIANANGTYGNAIGGDWVTLSEAKQLYDGSSCPWAKYCNDNKIRPKAVWVKFGSESTKSGTIKFSTLVPNYTGTTVCQMEAMLSLAPSTCMRGKDNRMFLISPTSYSSGTELLQLNTFSFSTLETSNPDLVSYACITKISTRTDEESFLKQSQLQGKTNQVLAVAKCVWIVAYKRG